MARFYTQDGEAVDFPEEKPLTVWELNEWRERQERTRKAIEKSEQERKEQEKEQELLALGIFCGMSPELLRDILSREERTQGEHKLVKRAIELQAQHGRRTPKNCYSATFSD